MATEHTVFDLTELKDILELHYPFAVLACAPIGFASANIYRVTTNCGIFCLKEFPSKITEEKLAREVYICRHLHEKGVPVPEHIKTKSGMASFSHKNHVCSLYHWMDGEHLPAHSGTPAQLAESAGLYGRILDGMSDISIQLPTPDMFDYSISAIDRSIMEHKLLLPLTQQEDVKQQLVQKIHMLERMKAFDWTGIESVTWQNSHGDYNPFQFLYQNGEISSVLDFMSARRMPIVFELFRNFLYMDPEAGQYTLSRERLADYLDAFQQSHSLNDADLRFMIPLYYLRILKSTFGYREYCHNPGKSEYLQLGIELFKQCVWLEAEMLSYSTSPISYSPLPHARFYL